MTFICISLTGLVVFIGIAIGWCLACLFMMGRDEDEPDRDPHDGVGA